MQSFKIWLEANEIIVPPGNLNVPRSEMPQIQASDVPKFLEYLKEKGVEYKKGKTNVSDLKATQKEIDIDKAKKMLTDKEEILGKPIITSVDDHIMDGHHRWLALKSKNKDFLIPSYTVDLPMKELIKVAKDFPGSFKKSI